MAEAFIGEIRITPYNFAPVGWALCNGQILSISANTALYSLFGTTYGGNGTTTFGLPNLQNSAPIQQGQGPGLSPYDLGQTGGESTVTLTQAEMANHVHAVACDPAAGSQQGAAGGVWAASAAGRASPPYYAVAATSPTPMNPAAIALTGGSQPHNNRSPYLGLNFIVALQGIYPARG
jgi:microcystin-dependent protein